MTLKNQQFRCKVCDNEFKRKNNCKSVKPLFCSITCYLISHKKKIYKCQNCEIEYYPKSGHSKTKTCSNKCKYELRSKIVNPKKGKKYHHNKATPKKICRTCGNIFVALGEHTGTKGGQGKRKQIYCAHSCYVKGNRVSKFEDDVYSYLLSKGLILNRQIKIKKWTFDFKLSERNIFIEADGFYWHSLKPQKERDIRKNEWCNSNGYEIYRINELDFMKNKESACQIIINRMLKLNPDTAIKRNGKDWKP